MDLNHDSPILQAIGHLAGQIYDEAATIQMYLHLIVAALFPIYIGAHASLRRPPMGITRDPQKQPRITENDDVNEDDDDEMEAEGGNVEGLTPSDAIMFPVLAGITLGGLYLLIKWLNNPALLNRILGWYFSSIGVVGVGKLAGDGLNVLTGFVFPSVWSSGQKVYHVDALHCQQVVYTHATATVECEPLTNKKVTAATTPLAGVLSKLKVPAPMSKILWQIRALATDKYIVRGHVRSFTTIKARIRLNDIVGMLIGFLAVVLYNNGKAWWLTNLMGFGFVYGTLQLMSPTTFFTGSLVLIGLFVYDIVMVFYTPMMVKVATTLDVPIKLVFPGPKRGSMLGLGDVVLPGIMMALALRFDLYMFYLKKQRSEATEPAANDIVRKSSTPPTTAENDLPKPTYYPATGHQGERFWTALTILHVLPFPLSLLCPHRTTHDATLPPQITGGIFPKPYFYASITGYVIAMLTTLYVLNVYNHAQPALLYLVPGVLGALWGTAAVRGEVGEMWGYSEEVPKVDEKEEARRGSEKGGSITNGQAVKSAREQEPVDQVKPDSIDKPASKHDGDLTTKEIKTANLQTTETKAVNLTKQDEHQDHILLFSLSRSTKAHNKSAAGRAR